jgi:hypothetical protein
LRSVFAHLWHTTEREVAAALDRLYPTQGRPWLMEVDGDPRLYIEIYHDGPVEDDEWHTRFSSCGGPPAVSVIANISGRHDGWPEVREFVARVLGTFDGVATDDDWSHLWSHDEVQSDSVVAGRRFGCWRDSQGGTAAG